MRPIRVAIPATGTPGPVVPLDIYQKGPVTVAIVSVVGAVNINVQYTLDDVFSPTFNQATAQWFAVSAALTGAVAAAAAAVTDANNNPIVPTAIRATNAGIGTAILQVVQSGITG